MCMREVMMRGCLIVLIAISGTLLGAAGQQAWDDATHGGDAAPDYTRVFAQDSVKRLDIQVTSEDWDALMADMSSMAGAFGAGGGLGFGGGGGGGPQMMPVPTENLATCVGR